MYRLEKACGIFKPYIMPLKNHAPDAKKLPTLYCFIMLGLARNHLLYYNLEQKLPSGIEEWLMLPCVPSTTPDL
jgi:hypothetical protein